MRLHTCLLAGVLAVTSSAVVAVPGAMAAPVDRPLFASPGTTVPFQVEEKTKVPGHVLKGGSYSITVVDHLSDRTILKITATNGKEQALFLAVPANSRIQKQVSAGPIALQLGAKNPALRGFAFPNGSVLEFVYPKAEAVALAKANSTSVPAIDPDSEGRPKANSLSSEDLQMVTLWMLTPTIVGSGKPGISAERLQVAEASVPPPPAVPPPPPPVPARATPAAAPPPIAPEQVAETAAPPKPRKVAHPIATLPHTASMLPVWFMTGFASLLAALLLSVRRRRTESAH